LVALNAVGAAGVGAAVAVGVAVAVRVKLGGTVAVGVDVAVAVAVAVTVMNGSLALTSLRPSWRSYGNSCRNTTGVSCTSP